MASSSSASTGHSGEPGSLIPQHLRTALNAADRAIMWICSLLMLAMFAVVIWAVFSRYVLNDSLLWGEELARYISIWMICLGLVLAHRRGAHVAVNSVLSWGRGGISKRIALRISETITFVLCVCISWFSWLAAIGNFRTGQMSPAMGIEIAWVYVAIPLGFALMALQSLIRLIEGPAVLEPEGEGT